MRRFTADASHQMRTPLSILRTHLQVLRSSGTSTPTGQASLDDIESAAQRLQNLLVQLLALARAESASGDEAAAIKPVDIVALAQLVALDCAPAALRSGVEIIFDGPERPIIVATEPSLATELLSNILDNAIRYNREEGEVVIRFEERDQRALVLVEDTGPGIPAGDRKAVFARFKRLERDPSRSGTGLGLAIVKALADAVGAAVELRDRAAGSGLLVEISFPKTNVPGAADIDFSKGPIAP